MSGTPRLLVSTSTLRNGKMLFGVGNRSVTDSYDAKAIGVVNRRIHRILSALVLTSPSSLDESTIWL
uniref:Transposase n=1 Tax=Rhabditophanes sp. KR3021 TaxID=114890 RepID=A0AC35TSY2_9BILA